MFTKRIIPCLDVNKGRAVQMSLFFWISQHPVKNVIR